MFSYKDYERLGNKLIDELGLKLRVADFDPNQRVVSLKHYGTKTPLGFGRVIKRIVDEELETIEGK